METASYRWHCAASVQLETPKSKRVFVLPWHFLCLRDAGEETENKHGCSMQCPHRWQWTEELCSGMHGTRDFRTSPQEKERKHSQLQSTTNIVSVCSILSGITLPLRMLLLSCWIPSRYFEMLVTSWVCQTRGRGKHGKKLFISHFSCLWLKKKNLSEKPHVWTSSHGNVVFHRPLLFSVWTGSNKTAPSYPKKKATGSTPHSSASLQWHFLMTEVRWAMPLGDERKQRFTCTHRQSTERHGHNRGNARACGGRSPRLGLGTEGDW